MAWGVRIAGLLLFALASNASAQPEVMAWGNLMGIRVDGQLMPFESSLAVVSEDWTRIDRTAKERQRPSYSRDSNRQIVSTRLDSLFFEQVVEDLGSGAARVGVTVTSRVDTSIAGVFFAVDLPREGHVDFVNPAEISSDADELLRASVTGIRFDSPRLRLEITSTDRAPVFLTRGREGMKAYFALASGPVRAGDVFERSFTIQASGEIDRGAVFLSLDTSRPGRKFDGLGGNFRLQNPRNDPPVIDYNLENLRVAWGRVDMPWMLWHPDEDIDPPGGDSLHPRVEAAMKMAHTLHEKDIPVMLAVWFPPQWAVLGEITRGRGADGLWGNQLDPAKTEQIYESITSYILYLKEHFGVDVEMFSFNESDLGIDVRQTAEEHAELIRGLGAYFASKGLKTKLLLGDTADARGYRFIDAAMEDPATHPYIGAVSFHSWRGWEDSTLAMWAAAAERLDVPLVVGEGSIDAGAWRYSAIFTEPTYAREEINLYVRMLALTQPLSILQWQLTSDYSILAGGGVFGNNDEPLHPTQRFWNLKQLASTPAGVFHMPITSSRVDVSAAAVGDESRGAYAIHLVNNGASREAILTGLPEEVKELRIFITDTDRAMEEGERIRPVGGEARFPLDATCFTTLIAEPSI